MELLSNRYKRVRCAEIIVERDARQRRAIDTSDIDDSIRLRGVYNPIIITRELKLIAGERRLVSSIKNGHDDIPCRFADELSDTELQIIELEENLRRQDLPWRDECASFARIHALYVGADPAGWTQEKTALSLGITTTNLANNLRVAKELGNPRLAQAPGLSAALNILSRENDRAVADIVTDIMEAGSGIVSEGQVASPADQSLLADGNDVDPETGLANPASALRPGANSAVQASAESILHTDFLSWAPDYRGPKFNFLHCDFPYGIKVFGGAWSGKRTFTTYEDAPDLYWAMIECLGQNLDRLLSHSAHVMFWFSQTHLDEKDVDLTRAALRATMPSIEWQKFSLIWHKTDNVGIAPNPKHEPRRVYETALIGTRGARPLVQCVSNAYGAPTDKSNANPHTKPVPVLNHFFRLFVDEHTRLLDPTCGSGTALRSAENLGAKHVLGLELGEETCKDARLALRQSRILRKATA